MTKVWLDWTGVLGWDEEVADMTAKSAKLALTEAILKFRKHEHDPEGLRQTAEEGYTPATRSLDFQQKDDPKTGYLKVYCRKCTKLIVEGSPSEVQDAPDLCFDCATHSSGVCSSTVVEQKPNPFYSTLDKVLRDYLCGTRMSPEEAVEFLRQTGKF